MEPRSHDPEREMHDNVRHAGEPERLSAAETRERNLERENSPQAVEERQDHMPPPSSFGDPADSPSGA
jgi:hypothetical protein